MTKQNYLRHYCDKIPVDPTELTLTGVMKVPFKSQNGQTFGRVSWKLIKARWLWFTEIYVDEEITELNPPICPFCNELLN